jgi:hypothetical protein
MSAYLGANTAVSRHSNCAPESEAAHQSAQLKKFRSAIRSQSSSSLRYSFRASDCSGALARDAARRASATAWEAHSLTVTTRTIGSAGLSPVIGGRAGEPERRGVLLGIGGVPPEPVDRHRPPRPQESPGRQFLRDGKETFTSTGVVYGVADPVVTGSPVAGVSA